MEWETKRIKEFLKLKKVIRIIMGLNNGNNFIQKIQEVITIAKELDDSDFTIVKTSETSFIDFLEELIKSDLAKLTRG